MGRSTKYPRQGQGIPLNQGCSPAAAPTEGPPQMPNKQLLPPSAVSSNGRHLPTVRYSVPRQQTEAGALPHAEGKDTRQPSVGGLCNAGCGDTWGVLTQATLQMHQTDARLQTAGLSLEDVCPHRKSQTGFWLPKESTPSAVQQLAAPITGQLAIASSRLTSRLSVAASPAASESHTEH